MISPLKGGRAAAGKSSSQQLSSGAARPCEMSDRKHRETMPKGAPGDPAPMVSAPPLTSSASLDFRGYDPENGPFFDEMFAGPARPRPGAEPLVQNINGFSAGVLTARQAAAERALLAMGITFTLGGENGGTERIFPFDIIPRIIRR